MSTGNWILVRAEDEARLSEWDGNVEREYFNGAHSSESFKTYHVGKQNMERTGGCGLGSKDKTFVREVNDPYKRPDHFHGPGPGTSMYEFNPKMKKNCHSTTWAGYTNPKHPWIVAASGYTIPVGAATQGGISLFKVPPNAPSGKYGKLVSSPAC